MNSTKRSAKPTVKASSKTTVKTAKKPSSTTALKRKTKPDSAIADGPGTNVRGRTLVIVESPTKARTLSRYLGASFIVMASGGHVRDLPERELGVDVANGFEPDYQQLAGKKRVVDALTNAAAGASRIFLATDPDREGEAIAWHIAQLITAKRGRIIQRVQFHEITKHAVEEALANPCDIEIPKVEAQQARRIMDRLVGYQVSPLLWKTVTGGLSAGRVQSVALRLICERDAAIDAFISQEYWTIEGKFTGQNVDPFLAKLSKLGGKKVDISDEKTAQSALALLKDRPYLITDIKRTTKKRVPPPPYITSTLQQDAGRRLGFPVKKTMSLAQKLYEGLEVGNRGQVGLITYMRTDSTRLSPEAVSDLRGWIAESYGSDAVCPTPRAYKNKKGPVQDAHEAIRPTDVRLTPNEVKSHLSADEFKIYDMIWRRFVATQMREAEYDVTTVLINSGPEIEFRASGQIITRIGYLVLYEQPEKNAPKKASQDDDAPEVLESSDGDLTLIPKNLSVGMPLQLLGLNPGQHFTEPLPRFSEASLVKELDDLGIGRPSTYATIISTLLDRTYAEKREKVLFPTDLGKTVNGILVDRFPDIFSVAFTAKMEEELDKIEEGAGWRQVMSDFYDPFRVALDTALGMRSELKKGAAQSVGRVCPDCGKDLIYRFGKKGRFISCSGYPECKHSENIDGSTGPVETDIMCPNCGKPMLKRTGRFGPFLGCSGYPTCKTILPLKTKHACPELECSGSITERRTKTGKTFYGCDRYPACQFVSWDAPAEGACPSCSAPTTFNKAGKGGGYRYCRRCEWKEKAEG